MQSLEITVSVPLWIEKFVDMIVINMGDIEGSILDVELPVFDWLKVSGENLTYSLSLALPFLLYTRLIDKLSALSCSYMIYIFNHILYTLSTIAIRFKPFPPPSYTGHYRDQYRQPKTIVTTRSFLAYTFCQVRNLTCCKKSKCLE